MGSAAVERSSRAGLSSKLLEGSPLAGTLGIIDSGAGGPDSPGIVSSPGLIMSGDELLETFAEANGIFALLGTSANELGA